MCIVEAIKHDKGEPAHSNIGDIGRICKTLEGQNGEIGDAL